jgi:signal transduction histidine kinase
VPRKNCARFCEFQAKDRVLATVSHELCPPLTSTLGWVRVLKTLTGEDYDRAVESIERNAVLQLKLTEDLIDFSRLAAGTLSLTGRRVDLGTSTNQVVQMLNPLVPKQLVLTLTCPNQRVEIFGDELRLGQILTNLLSNAVKFTDTGGSIQVTLIRAGATCELSVKDNGKGISAEFLPRVFDLFVQESASESRWSWCRTDVVEGTGRAASRHNRGKKRWPGPRLDIYHHLPSQRLSARYLTIRPKIAVPRATGCVDCVI